jgi:hypothetical protein
MVELQHYVNIVMITIRKWRLSLLEIMFWRIKKLQGLW